MQIGFLGITLVKIAAILAYIYGLMWVLGQKQWWAKGLGILAGFGIVQLGPRLRLWGG